MTAKDLTKLLSERYRSPEYAFLPQVRNQTGYASREGVRTVDGLALSHYPSRGIYLHGFEIKVYRSDWLTEKAKPEKADAIGKYCNFWVAPDINTVVPAELPESWGLLVEYNGKLVIVKQAVFMKPEPLTTAIVAGIFRKVSETTVPQVS